MPHRPLSSQLKPIVAAFILPLTRLVAARYPQSATARLEVEPKILSWTAHHTAGASLMGRVVRG